MHFHISRTHGVYAMQGWQELSSLASPVQNGTVLNDVPYNTSALPGLQHSLNTVPGDGVRTPTITLQRLAHELETHLAGLPQLWSAACTSGAHPF